MARAAAIKEITEKTPTRWVEAGEVVRIDGRVIPGGCFYAGGTPVYTGRMRLIDPAWVAVGRIHERAMAEARRAQIGGGPTPYVLQARSQQEAYLDWLAAGRPPGAQSERCLAQFFFGLERRLLSDLLNSGGRKPAYLEVARALRDIGVNYPGAQLVPGRALELMDVVISGFLHEEGEVLADIPPSVGVTTTYDPRGLDGRSAGGSLRLFVGLARFALAGRRLPVDWAVAWAKVTSLSGKHEIWRNSPALVEKVFRARYTKRYGAGVFLEKAAPNMNYLRAPYYPSSPALIGTTHTVEFPYLPDIDNYGTVRRILDPVFTDCWDDLAAYAHFKTATQGKAASGAAGELLLPVEFWPAWAKEKAEDIRARMSTPGYVAMTLKDLKEAFNPPDHYAYGAYALLVSGLESLGIGIEPPVFAKSKLPEPDTLLVAFPVKNDKHKPIPLSITACIEAACLLSHASGGSLDVYYSMLEQMVQRSKSLTTAQKSRLLGRIRWHLLVPLKTGIVTRKFKKLGSRERETLSRFILRFSQRNREPSPEQVKLLGLLFRRLGVDEDELYDRLHQGAVHRDTGRGPGKLERDAHGHLKIDHGRVKALREETVEVHALLSDVFRDEEVPVLVEEPTTAQVDDDGGLPLDESHLAFLRSAIVRPSWIRAELASTATGAGLMLDGALERINETVAESLEDKPDFTGELLFEGEDPVEVNMRIVTAIAPQVNP